MKTPSKQQSNRRNNGNEKSQHILVLRQIHIIGNQTNLLRHRQLLGPGVPRRAFAGFILRHALKIRYWVAGGLFGTTIAASKWYEDFKQKLPDFSLPEWTKKFEDNPFLKVGAKYDEIKSKWDAHDFTQLTEWKNKLSTFELKWKNADDDLTKGQAFCLDIGPIGNQFWLTTGSTDGNMNSNPAGGESILASIFGTKTNTNSEKSDEWKPKSDGERLKKLQDEMIKTQMQYQRELERLERENKALKSRILLKDSGEQRRLRKIKRSLIDMYSEMLDLLNEYDASYSITDNLPRVVVVGDQSAGKTSVLEMIAQARIFPRGAGEMMTRAPVKVTLSEGPYHVAQFRDSSREFDLTKEDDLQQLRNEIELRMRNSVKGGKTVSHEVISLTVKGPELPRMVLVDLPGVISTVTADMARETKDDIIRMCRQHMENPNAIILCIQDGSVDAERSNVTDLVSSIDPKGSRTILVLTKVDLAEKNLANPHRIKRILEGKLFPMKAIGYYGVVTGKDTKDATIEEIRDYEEKFFETSKLFKDGILKPSQMTTRNMSMAVSDCFWKMVRDTIEAQADAFRATRFNLETEWKNTFPRMRELDRDELFDKARSEILDECVNLSLLGHDEWDEILKKTLWSSISPHVFDQILMPASNSLNAGTFNTLIDIKLKHWADKGLANEAIQVGWQTLSDVYKRQFESSAQNRNHDELFDKLKFAVLDAALKEHQWDSKALDYLRVIQLNAMEDRMVPDNKSWEAACSFMQKAVNERLQEVHQNLDDARGPGFWSKWFKWQSRTNENDVNLEIQKQLRQILIENPEHKLGLSDDDITVVRRAVEAAGVSELTNDAIREQWRLVFREHFLERMKRASNDCSSFYQNYKQGFNESDVDCHAVILFYRLQKMLDLSCNALRQQITNTEQRRLEKEIKEVLDDWQQEAEKKKEFLTGRRVELAEELKQVRFIQEKLEEFMVQLHREKN
uniref:Dynamin-like 120 kDa protein, mitochondrial n=1 Tax=Panagrolaimus sp. PS1159 TaxID=55785 RepID=A0AC35GAX0_9BILA